MTSKVVFFKALSGVHCGIGQGLSDIDLPVARDKVTGHPIIPGASIKGVIRDHFESIPNCDEKMLEVAFGAKEAKNIEFAAALTFGDARLLALPVRSYFGTFAYVASPCTLAMLKDLLERNGSEIPAKIPSFEPNAEHYKATATTETLLKIAGDHQQRILLEEVDLLPEPQNQAAVDELATLIANLLYKDDAERQRLFKERFLVVDDNVLNFFCEANLPVAARIRIDNEKGTVQQGALWYEESVPAETIFISTWNASDGRGRNSEFKADQMLNQLTEKRIICQIGGNATTGHGMVSISFA